MFAVVVRTGVVVVVLERHVLCAFGGQVSEARVECTFLANDAAYLTLSRAVTQLRRSEIVAPGVGLTVCVVCGVSNGKVGFGRAFSLHSQSECIIFGVLQSTVLATIDRQDFCMCFATVQLAA